MIPVVLLTILALDPLPAGLKWPEPLKEPPKEEGVVLGNSSVWAPYLGCATLDVVSTEMAIAQGGREINPLLKAKPVRILFKYAMAVLLAHMDAKHNFGWARWPIAGVWCGMGVWNLTQLK